MNKLKRMLCAVFTLMLVNISTTAQSDSGNFAGPYVGLQVLGLGAEFDGVSNSSAGTGTASGTASEDRVPIGATKATVGIEIGYVIPLGSLLALDIGGQMLSGEAKIDHTNSTGNLNAGNVSMTMDDHYTYYIAPTIILSDTSSLYIKAGVSQADVNVSGDVNPIPNLHGEMWAIGTRTVLPSGIFIRTEAGYTEYNEISTHGKGGGTAGKDYISTSTSFQADTTIVHGNLSLGFRF